MTHPHPARATATAAAIAAQEGPGVSRLAGYATGLGALLSGLFLLLGADELATTTTTLFLAGPLLPALSAAVVLVCLLVLTATSGTPKSEGRRQTITAANLLLILGFVFFFVEFSARFELSLFFALMLFAWGVRMHRPELRWAALPYLLAAVALRVWELPGEPWMLLGLGALTLLGAALWRTPAPRVGAAG